MDQKKRTEIASLGQFGLIDLLTSGFTPKNASTLKGAGDDAAVIAPGRGEAVLCTTDSFYEGVDFDLTYFPLKHLGYKVVTAGVSDILAMNALPAQITVSLGVSSKLPVEALQDLYEGIAFACKEQEIDLVGGDTRASMTGLVITVTTLGYAKKEKVVYRSGAQQNDLVCITGNLGAAYMGLQLLEREKRVLADVENPEPQFKGYEYLLEKYLKPRPRTDIVRTLAEEKIRPTSMIDLSDGLASDLMQICKSSACGARIGCVITRNKELYNHAMKWCQGRLCASTIDQVASAALYSVGPEYFDAVRKEYCARKDTLVEGLKKIPGVVYSEPKGAFYVMAALPVDDAEKFQIWMLEEFDDNGDTLMFTPAESFYKTPHTGVNEIRMAYVINEKDITRCMELLKKGIEAYLEAN